MLHPALTDRFSRLERTRNLLTDKINTVSDLDFNRFPKADAWSIAQTIYHVMKVEELSMHYMRRKLAPGVPIKNNDWRGHWRSLFLSTMLKLPLRYKAPKVLGEMPLQLDRQALLNAWQQNRNELNQLLLSIDDEHLDKVIFKHPLAGKLSVFQALDFLSDHQDRHFKQVLRTLEQLGKK